MNRRRLLTTVGTSTSAFAGCIAGSGDEMRRVSTDSEIRKQPTDDHPPEIVFSLTPESNEPITVSANNEKPFVNFSRLTGKSGTIVLLPITDTHVRADVASTQTNSCWRFVDADGNETHIVYDDIADQLTLQPGLTHHVTHKLFVEGEESGCFSDGDYTADHTMELHDAEHTITFTVQVTFSDGRLSDVEVQR